MPLRDTTKDENGVIVIPSGTEWSRGISRIRERDFSTSFGYAQDRLLRSLEMTWERSFILEADTSILTPQALSDIIIGVQLC